MELPLLLIAISRLFAQKQKERELFSPHFIIYSQLVEGERYCGSIEPAMIYLVYILLSQLLSSPIRISEENTYFVNIPAQTNLSLLSRHPSNEPAALFMLESDADYFYRACRVSYLVLIHISVHYFLVRSLVFSQYPTFS